MPYVYEVSFEIAPEQMSELEIGRSLERLVGYMKIRLPVQSGFVFAGKAYQHIRAQPEARDPGRGVFHEASKLMG